MRNTLQINDRKRNVTLDAFKGIACLMVILIHRKFPGDFGEIVQALGRAAVAFFFITSGYFAWNQDHVLVEKRLLKRCIHILKITAWALLFYLFWESMLRYVGSGPEKVIEWLKNEVFTINTLYSIGVWDIDPLAGHLWFLFALIRVYLIVWLLYRLKLEKVIPYLPVVLWIAIYALEFYHSSLSYYRNGWLYGMAYFSAGYSFASAKWKLCQKFKMKQLILCCILGAVCTIIEYYLFGELQMYIGTVIIGCSAFLIALDIKNTNNRLVYELAELGLKYSTTVYILHWAVVEVAMKLDKEFVFSAALWYQWLVPILVMIVSVAGSVAWCKFYGAIKTKLKRV